MIRFFSAAFLLMILIAGCSSPAAPTATSFPTATPLALLPTLNSDVLLLTPNQSYYVLITFAYSTPATVSIELSDQKVSFNLETQNTPSETPVFDALDQTSLTWGMPYILYALNRQPGQNTPSSRSTEGTLILSRDGKTLAYFLCNEYGGRGQWCSDAHLWLFDIPGGDARQADFGESDLLYIGNLYFSDDNQTLTGDSCLRYANAYFGYCGTMAVMTWDVTTGALLNMSTPSTVDPFQ